MSTAKKSAARAVADLSQGMIIAVVEIESPPERVFTAISTGEVAQWWGSNDTYRVTDWKADLRPGGTWLSTGRNQDGTSFSVGGEVLEVDPPRRFAHTWAPAWDGGNVTTVRFTLDSTPGGTRVTVCHEGFGERTTSCQSHTEGWERVLSWLGKHFSPANLPALPMKAVLHYETELEKMALARQHFGAHRSRLDAFHARGALHWVGMYENPADGALGIFASRADAEAFVKEDPFILHGVVTRYTIRGWNEIYP